MGDRDRFVVERLAAWRQRLDRGTVGRSCRLLGVVAHEEQILSAVTGSLWEDLDWPAEDVGALADGRGARGGGLTVASAEGLVLAGPRHGIERNVAWAEVRDVRFVPALASVVVRRCAPGSPSVAIWRRRRRFVPHASGLALAKLLTIEAAWHVVCGDLDAWYSRLPERLAIGLT